MESDVQETTLSPTEQFLDRFLPLPYRVATLIVLGKRIQPNQTHPIPNRHSKPKPPTNPPTGFHLYTLNLRHLSTHSIDVPHLLTHPPSPNPTLTTNRLTLTLLLPLLFLLCVHAIHPTTLLPLLYLYLYIPSTLLVPSAQLSRRGRGRFLKTLGRVGLGGLAKEGEGRFADVLVADVLTSYAKPLADLWVVGCEFWGAREGSGGGGGVDRACGGGWVVPGLVAVPFL